MEREIRSINCIKTLMGMKYRSLPKAQRSNEGELYLLKNNLDLAQRELGSVLKRKMVVEGKIEDITQRIEELERGLKVKTSKDTAGHRSIKASPKNAIKVMKVDY